MLTRRHLLSGLLSLPMTTAARAQTSTPSSLTIALATLSYIKNSLPSESQTQPLVNLATTHLDLPFFAWQVANGRTDPLPLEPLIAHHFVKQFSPYLPILDLNALMLQPTTQTATKTQTPFLYIAHGLSIPCSIHLSPDGRIRDLRIRSSSLVIQNLTKLTQRLAQMNYNVPAFARTILS